MLVVWAVICTCAPNFILSLLLVWKCIKNTLVHSRHWIHPEVFVSSAAGDLIFIMIAMVAATMRASTCVCGFLCASRFYVKFGCSKHYATAVTETNELRVWLRLWNRDALWLFNKFQQGSIACTWICVSSLMIAEFKRVCEKLWFDTLTFQQVFFNR